VSIQKATGATYKVSRFCDVFLGRRDKLQTGQKRAMSVPIVGIGASAGGLESIFEFIAGIPAGTGMAYVFVQHLDPRHGSDLVKILFWRAALPGMPSSAIQTGCVDFVLAPRYIAQELIGRHHEIN
jgi:chemotaxis response regulator CheB